MAINQKGYVMILLLLVLSLCSILYMSSWHAYHAEMLGMKSEALHLQDQTNLNHRLHELSLLDREELMTAFPWFEFVPDTLEYDEQEGSYVFPIDIDDTPMKAHVVLVHR